MIELKIDKKKQRLLDEFEELGKKIRQQTQTTINETEAEKKARIEFLLSDPRAFQEYYFPNLKSSPDYLIDAAKAVLADPFFFGWWMMFRGARKTTWLTLILPLMLIFRGQMRFFLLLGANENFSIRILGNLQIQLENNQRLLHDFGVQVRHGSWADGEFTTQSGVTFLGLGMGQPVRGLNVDQVRPDYIVASDLDSKELSKNPARCPEMFNWLKEDVIGTFETGAAVQRFVFDNNYFSKMSIGHLLKEEIPDLTVFRVDALKEDGTPAADFISPEWIADKRKKLGLRSFSREYMNTPIEEGHVYKADWVRYAMPLPLAAYDYLVSYNDPSFKAKKTSDFKAIVLIGKIGTKLHILRAFCRQCSVGEMVKWHYDLEAAIAKAGAVCYHYIEANMLQDIFLDAYVEEGRERGWQMPIHPDTDRKGDKFQRIEVAAVLWENGHVEISSELENDPDFKVGLEQILAFEKGASAHDDFPDCCEGATAKLQNMTRDSWTDDCAPTIGKREFRNSY